MRRTDFHFELPPALIAQEPPDQRSASRLLVLGCDGPVDRRFSELPDLVNPDDLFVFNDTRVFPARLFARKEPGGGRVEVMIERILSPCRARAQLRSNKALKPGLSLRLADDLKATLEARASADSPFFELTLPEGRDWFAVCEVLGHVPLPPYIRRPDRVEDRARYQTVFARTPGAVAAPTAGLHFDEDVLARLRARGVEFAFVTLHVGAGTFQPMRVEDLATHRMHAEYAQITPEACDRIQQAKRAGRRVVAVGTTVARTLEAAASSGTLKPLAGEISNFIYPGHSFTMVDALITNFHLPESTLLMLVCALGGTERVLSAYRHAVLAGYRFYSYGDAMWVSGAADAGNETAQEGCIGGAGTRGRR